MAGSTDLFGNPISNCSGSITDSGYNISDDSTCGFSKTGSANNGDGVNPLLSTDGLANNGGPTETIALQSGSPAIDAIPHASCTDQATPPNQLTTDQRGFGRPDPGDGPDGPCDIGAYESGAVATPIACTVTYNDTFNGNLTITSGLTCIINATVTGNLTQSGGGLFAYNAAIGGNLQIAGGSFSIDPGTTIDGNLQIQNIPAGSAQNQICGTEVKGNLQFHNNRAAVAIGTASGSCPGNTIGGNLQVNNNIAAVQVSDDAVGGNLQCQNNSSITGSGDTAKSLQGQCAAF